MKVGDRVEFFTLGGPRRGVLVSEGGAIVVLRCDRWGDRYTRWRDEVRVITLAERLVEQALTDGKTS